MHGLLTLRIHFAGFCGTLGQIVVTSFRAHSHYFSVLDIGNKLPPALALGNAVRFGLQRCLIFLLEDVDSIALQNI